MLDIKFIRENKELIVLASKRKKVNVDLDKLIQLDDKRLELVKKFDELKFKQNDLSSKIQSANQLEKESLIEQSRVLKEDIKKIEEELNKVLSEWRSIMLQVPNIPDMSVPDGESDADNVEIKKWGEETNFTFEAKDHITLMEQNDMVDFERGTKTAGFRGYFLKNDGALLQMALWQYVMQKWIKKGYSPMIVPSMVKKQALYGSGYLPQGEEDLYKDGDDYLSGTGEVATMYYYSDEVLNKQDFPKKFISFSTCFRKEAGSHGKDVKGLIRVHEFYKLEQVILCEASHEESVKYHEELLRNAEELLEELNLPYHTVVNCAADLGLGQVKKYDIEVWMPSQKKYRETHSCSYFHDFQTRRLNIRYKDENGKMRFAHSLNNTAAATPRLVAAIIENYQNQDGSIRVPEVLIPYVGKTILGK